MPVGWKQYLVTDRFSALDSDSFASVSAGPGFEATFCSGPTPGTPDLTEGQMSA